MAENEKENMVKVEELLAKKTAGGILNVENYDFLNKFVERVETRTFIRSKLEEEAERNRMEALREQIPPSFFETNILDSELPEHVNYILQEAGFNTVAELVIKMIQAPDDILRLNGIGPKAMKSIQDLMDSLPEVLASEKAEEPVIEATPEVVVAEPVEEVELQEVVEEEVEEVEEIATEEIFEEEQKIPEELEETEPMVDLVEEEIEISEEVEEEEESPEEELSFDELFALQSTDIEIPFVEDEEEDMSSDKKAKKKKDKKKKRQVKVEYDDEEDVLIYRKIHKRDDDFEWE